MLIISFMDFWGNLFQKTAGKSGDLGAFFGVIREKLPQKLPRK